MAGYVGNIPVPQSTQTRQSFTATASQTSFPTIGYTEGFFDCHLNGVKLLAGVDFNVGGGNGSDVILATGAALNDILEVTIFDTFNTSSGTFSSTTLKNNVTLKNDTHEDSDGGRASKIIYQGEQSGGEISTLAEIQASHDGSSDDQKSDLIFRTNDGSDGASPTERLRIDSDGSIITATLGTDNVHLGEGAGASIASGGNENVAIGKDALQANTTASNNTAVGVGSSFTNTTGTENTSIGAFASYYNTTGDFNVSVGKNALTSNTTSSNNTAVGYQAGYASTAADLTAIGFKAGNANTTGAYNTFVGKDAGLSNTTGTLQTFIGEYSGRSTTGTNNTFLGQQSGTDITSGTKNTIIGRYTGNGGGLDIRTTNNNIVLSDGDGSPVGYRSGSDGTWYFDNAAGSQSAITARNTGTGGFPYGININYPNAAPNNDSGRFFTCSDSSAIRLKIFNNGNVVNQNNSYGVDSDIKLKENIVDAPSQWDDIKAVTVRKYSLKSDNLDEPNMLGVVAQELETAGMNGLVNETADIDKDLNDLGTTTKSVKTSILYMKAVKALQEAMTRIETLETQNTTQATQIADLITRVTALEAE